MKDIAFSFEGSQIARHPKTAFREVDEDIFLVHPDGETLFNLNPTAAALWRLMETPMSASEMAGILATAFPDMPKSTIKGDVANIIGELVNLGFATVQ